jgi:hypothetical protein
MQGERLGGVIARDLERLRDSARAGPEGRINYPHPWRGTKDTLDMRAKTRAKTRQGKSPGKLGRATACRNASSSRRVGAIVCFKAEATPHTARSALHVSAEFNNQDRMRQRI